MVRKRIKFFNQNTNQGQNNYSPANTNTYNYETAGNLTPNFDNEMVNNAVSKYGNPQKQPEKAAGGIRPGFELYPGE